MQQVRVDNYDEFPEMLNWQAVSFMRVQWPFIYSGSNRFGKNTYPPEWHPIHFSIVEEDVLISYAGVIQVDIEHAGQTYKACGLGNVFTFPPFRRNGYGTQVVQAATEHILQSDVDIGILFCDSPLASFYAASGWESKNDALTREGTPDNYLSHESLRMMLFISEKGRRGRNAFANQPLYIRHSW